LKRDLGDGFSVDAAGRLAAIRGISMSSVWHYYASPVHPENCTLWGQLGRGSGAGVAAASRR
jgi:hypothetical protein